MSWVAAGIGAAGAIASFFGQRKANKQAQAAAKAASGPTTETVTRTPWGPTEQPRIDIINRAMALLGGSAAGAPGSGSGGGGGTRRSGGTRRGGGGSGGGGGIDYNAYIRKFLDGDYITANPYIDSVVADLQDEYNRQAAANALSQRTNWRTGSDAAALENSLNLGQLLRSEGQVRAADYNARQAERAEVMGQALDYDARNRATNAQRAVGMAGVSVQRGYLRNAQAMLPYQQLGSVADILNAAGGQYGTTTSVTQGPPKVAQTQSPWLAGIQGGLAAYNLANSWGAGGTNWGGTKIPATTTPGAGSPSWGNYIPTLNLWGNAGP